MATVDTGSIPQQTLNIVTLGVTGGTTALADQICRRRTDVETLKGKAPFLTSDATTRRRENVDLAPGSAAKPSSGKFGDVPYNCLRQTGAADIFDESQISAAAYDLDLIAHWVEEARKQANVNTDAKFEGVLESTTLNQNYVATSDGGGAWTDVTNGTPITDLQRASKLVANRDTVIMGLNALSALQAHPESYGRVAGFTGGTNGTVEELQAFIAAICRVPADRVFLLDDENAMFNAASEGQDFDKDYVFKDGIWIGWSQDLQLFDPQHAMNNFSELARHPLEARTILVHNRYVDIKRMIVENGVTISGAIASGEGVF